MSRLRSSTLHFVGAFSPDLYVSASLSLLLFSYTQVAQACLSYLACVDVGGVSVVFSQPAMRCSSADYQRTLVLVAVALAVYVAGFPLAVLLFLWRRSDLVRDSHALIVARAQARAAAANQRADAEDGVDVGSIADPDSGRTSSAGLSDSADGSGSGGSSSPSTAGAAHFLRRYSPLFSMYAPSAWFWQVFVLVRRTVFVAVSVTLVRSTGDRNLAFSLSHLASLLVQLQFRPFQASFFNRAEAAFHVLLIVLSMTLSAKLPPLARGTEIFIFLLVVPPLGLYLVAAVAGHYFGARADRAEILAAKIDEQRRAEEEQWAAPHSNANAAADVDVELSAVPKITINSHSPPTSPFALRPAPLSPSAMASARGGSGPGVDRGEVSPAVAAPAADRHDDEDFSVDTHAL